MRRLHDEVEGEDPDETELTTSSDKGPASTVEEREERLRKFLSPGRRGTRVRIGTSTSTSGGRI